MIKIKSYAPTHVGPSKLDQVLAYCVELSEENKQKVCIIQDIAKLGKLLNYVKMPPDHFYTIYEQEIPVLEGVQFKMQIEWNTEEYKVRLNELHKSN